MTVLGRAHRCKEEKGGGGGRLGQVERCGTTTCNRRGRARNQYPIPTYVPTCVSVSVCVCVCSQTIPFKQWRMKRSADAHTHTHTHTHSLLAAAAAAAAAAALPCACTGRATTPPRLVRVVYRLYTQPGQSGLSPPRARTHTHKPNRHSHTHRHERTHREAGRYLSAGVTWLGGRKLKQVPHSLTTGWVGKAAAASDAVAPSSASSVTRAELAGL